MPKRPSPHPSLSRDTLCVCVALRTVYTQVLLDPTFNPLIAHIQGRWNGKPRWHLDVVVHPARVAERAHVSCGDVYYGGADSDRKKEVERAASMPACRCRSGAGERREGVVSVQHVVASKPRCRIGFVLTKHAQNTVHSPSHAIRERPPLRVRPLIQAHTDRIVL